MNTTIVPIQTTMCFQAPALQVSQSSLHLPSHTISLDAIKETYNQLESRPSFFHVFKNILPLPQYVARNVLMNDHDE
jgi:hypothetical protein